MINNLFVLSVHNAAYQGYPPHALASGILDQPRFQGHSNQYDRYDRRIQSAPTFSGKLGAIADRFIATTVPDLTLTEVEDLTPKNLRRLGDIQGVIFDLDDTLMPILSGKFPDSVLKTLKHLHKAGIKMGVVTNNMQPSYCRNARELLRAEDLDLPFIEDAQKPHPAGFIAMRDHLGLHSGQVAVVGDGYLCDIRNANLLGMKTVQATWFTPGNIAGTASYTVDTVVALAQTLRANLYPPSKPVIIDARYDALKDSEQGELA